MPQTEEEMKSRRFVESSRPVWLISNLRSAFFGRSPQKTSDKLKRLSVISYSGSLHANYLTRLGSQTVICIRDKLLNFNMLSWEVITQPLHPSPVMNMNVSGGEIKLPVSGCALRALVYVFSGR